MTDCACQVSQQNPYLRREVPSTHRGPPLRIPQNASGCVWNFSSGIDAHCGTTPPGPGNVTRARDQLLAFDGGISARDRGVARKLPLRKISCEVRVFVECSLLRLSLHRWLGNDRRRFGALIICSAGRPASKAEARYRGTSCCKRRYQYLRHRRAMGRILAGVVNLLERWRGETRGESNYRLGKRIPRARHCLRKH